MQGYAVYGRSRGVKGQKGVYEDLYPRLGNKDGETDLYRHLCQLQKNKADEIYNKIIGKS